MHYIRLLRPPTLSKGIGKQSSLDIILTINTDLGDSLLHPDEPLPLIVSVLVPSDAGIEIPVSLTPQKLPVWEAGSRVLKLNVPLPYTKRLPSQDTKAWRICIAPVAMYSAASAGGIVSSLGDPGRGLVMPVWADVVSPGDSAAHICLRRLRLGDDKATQILEVEEDLGESMARHIWDSSIVAVPILHGLRSSSYQIGDNASMQNLKRTLSADRPLNVIELGCGVGIFGIGIGHILSATGSSPSKGSVILLTDLPDAENKARANIDRFPASKKEAATVHLRYENLDWEDGRLGTFGSEVSARKWDLVILSDCTYNIDTLPALVETLSQLHQANMTHHKSTEGAISTQVLLVTKPRHSSETAAFDLMAGEGWSIKEHMITPLPVLGQHSSGPQSVELHLFQKP